MELNPELFGCDVIDIASKSIWYATLVEAYGTLYQSIHGKGTPLTYKMSTYSECIWMAGFSNCFK